MKTGDLCDEVLISLRRIVRAVDLQSRKLVRSHGLTGPQVVILKELLQMESTTVGHLADKVNLSKPTVTDILNRLEKNKLVKRVRSKSDKRYIKVTVTRLARKKLESSPPLLQEEFSRQFNQLKKWEQFQLLSSLDKIAVMMDANKLDASPILSSGPISTPEDISEISFPDQQIKNSTSKYAPAKNTG